MNSYMDKEKNLFVAVQAEKLYRKSCNDTLKDFPPSERQKYYKNGNRNDFEKLYFNRRDYLSSCALLSLFDDRYIPTLEKIILAICDEYCWALPAHVPGIKSIDESVIDLFVAETSFALAEISTVFSEKLSEAVLERVKKEIEKRLVKNYIKERFWWEKCSMNWAAVCGAYTAGSLLYLFPDEFKKQKNRLFKTLECYTDGFTDDGFCLEGPSYWLYGFTAFTVFADLLCKFTDGKEDLFRSDKVKKISSYASGCLLKGNTAVSFSDADINFKPDLALQRYLHKKLPDYVPYLEKEKLCLHNANTKWINYYRAIIWNDEKQSTPSSVREAIFSPSAAQLIINKPLYSFAFKGGSNDEPHNHNDLGSFIYSDTEGQVFCDLGAGRYTRDYFDDDKRYSIFCNSSLGHSVPIINGKAQGAGSSFSADFSYVNDVAVCDITKAYAEEKIISIIRKIQIKYQGISITDSFSFEEALSVTERFVSKRKALIKEGELVFGATSLKYPKDKVTLKIKEEKHSPHEYDKADITVYCYDFLLKKGIKEICFEITTENEQ